MAASTWRRPSPRPAGTSDRPSASRRRPRSSWSRGTRLGVVEGLVARGHPLTLARPFDSGLGEEHAIELVDGGPGAPGGSLAAATDPRSEGLPAVW